MDNLQPQIRNAVRAIILKDNKLLVLIKQDPVLGQKYSLPGGGQEAGESITRSLARECMEEIGAEIKIVKLLHVAEFYKQKDTDPISTVHTVDFIFLCEVAPEYQAQCGDAPDKRQTGVTWIELSQLASVTLSPPYVNSIFPLSSQDNACIYIDA